MYVRTQHMYIRNNLNETIVRTRTLHSYSDEADEIFFENFLQYRTVRYRTVNEKSKTGILIDFGLKIFLRVRVFLCYRKIDENDCTFVRTLLKTLSFIRGEYSPNSICMYVPFFLRSRFVRYL